MTDLDVPEYTIVLDPLPSTPLLKLADAMEFAFYGGIRRIEYDGHLSQEELDGLLEGLYDTGQFVLYFGEFRLRGPRILSIPRAGSIYFGIDENSRPDPTQLEANNKRNLARGRRRNELALINEPPLHPESLLPFWKAELLRRGDEFQARLNDAARSGALIFYGTEVETAFIEDESAYLSSTVIIPATYFASPRLFDDECGAINSVDWNYEGLLSHINIASKYYKSYTDVYVELESYIRFLALFYPELLKPDAARRSSSRREAVRLLTAALHDNPDMTRAEAANLVGREQRQSEFGKDIWPMSRQAAGLPAKAPSGRKKSTQR